MLLPVSETLLPQSYHYPRGRPALRVDAELSDPARGMLFRSGKRKFAMSNAPVLTRLFHVALLLALLAVGMLRSDAAVGGAGKPTIRGS